VGQVFDVAACFLLIRRTISAPGAASNAAVGNHSGSVNLQHAPPAVAGGIAYTKGPYSHRMTPRLKKASQRATGANVFRSTYQRSIAPGRGGSHAERYATVTHARGAEMAVIRQSCGAFRSTPNSSAHQ